MSKYRAFTLMEITVILSIFTLVMGIAYTTLSLNETYRDLVLTKIQLYRQNKKAVDTITAELQRSAATHWTIIDGGGSNPDIIAFQIPLINSIDAQYNIPWGARFDSLDYSNYSIQYRLVEVTYLIRILADPDGYPLGAKLETITGNVTNLQFTSLNPNYIKINITSKRRMIRGWTITSDLESTVFLRN